METAVSHLSLTLGNLMTENTNKDRREKFEEEAERIRNSDRGISETADAIEEVREKYYNSKWEKMEEDIEDIEDYKRYAFIVGSGLISALIGAGIFSIAGFGAIGAVVFGITIILVASVHMTKPGLQFMREFNQQTGGVTGQQQNSGSTDSNQKTICQSCGWTNPMKNDFCHDCGGELSS